MNHAFRMKLKPGKVAEYRRRHDEIWPELAQLLRDAGIYDYSIFLDEATLHLFAVLKLRETNKRAAAAAASGHAALVGLHARPDGNPSRRPAGGMAAGADVPSRLNRSQEIRAQPVHDIEAATIDAQIQLLIRNLVEIKDTSGEFLLRLDDGRVIDTKGWNDWEWTHGIGLYGIWKYYEQTGDARCRRSCSNWFRDRFAAGTPTKNINTVAPFLTLAYLYEETPQQRLAALSRRPGPNG